VVLRSYLIDQFSEVDLDLPTDVFPILPRVAELLGLRAFPAIGLRDSTRENASIHEGEDKIARRDTRALTRNKDSSRRWRCAWATKDNGLELRDGTSGSG